MTIKSDIEIAQVSVTEDLAVETASGDVELTNVKARELRLRSASGDIQLERICAELLAIESRSGDMELQQVLAKEEFLCRSTSGDISLAGCDAPKMGFATVSGDITGSLLHGSNNLGVGVAEQRRTPRTHQIDVVVAVHIHHIGAVRRGDEHRVATNRTKRAHR